MQTTRNAKTAVQEWSERQGPRKRGPTSDKLAKETLPTLLMSKSPGLVGALVSGPRRVYLSLAIPPQQDKGGLPSRPGPQASPRCYGAPQAHCVPIHAFPPRTAQWQAALAKMLGYSGFLSV